MSPASRRLFALVTVFLAAFLAVSAMRTCRAGGGLGALFSRDRSDGQFRPEKFTLPDKAPVDLGDVELLSRLNDEYANLTRAVVPSVVSIDTAGFRTERMRDIWGRARVRQYPTQGQGSGVIVTDEGHVVTNHHVIAGQQQIQVTLHDGKTYPANLIGEDDLLDQLERLGKLRDRLESTLLETVEGVTVNGDRAHRLPNTSHLSFAGCDAAGLLILMDEAGVACSAGSACMSGKQQPSHVQLAMGIPAETARTSLRLSLSKRTSEDDIDRAADHLRRAVEKLRRVQGPGVGPVVVYTP